MYHWLQLPLCYPDIKAPCSSSIYSLFLISHLISARLSSFSLNIAATGLITQVILELDTGQTCQCPLSALLSFAAFTPFTINTTTMNEGDKFKRILVTGGAGEYLLLYCTHYYRFCSLHLLLLSFLLMLNLDITFFFLYLCNLLC